LVDRYFGYGSNMSSARLRERIPEARPLGAASLSGWCFSCNKRGRDGSGKANVLLAASTVVWGVVFELPDDAWSALDGFEWGYERTACRVEHAGATLEAQMYVALEPHDLELPPYDWYRDHMLQGAREHRLPDDVIRALSALPVRSREV
jgi:hypothetical protein